MSTSPTTLAGLLARLDSGSLTVLDLQEAREVIRYAVEALRSADERIAVAQDSRRDATFRAALTGIIVGRREIVSTLVRKAYALADEAEKQRGGS